MTLPFAAAQRTSLPPGAGATLQQLVDYFTEQHQPGGMDPVQMARLTFDSRAAQDSRPRNAAGQLLSSSGDPVNDLGQRIDASGNLLGIGSISYWEAGKQVGGIDQYGKDMGTTPDWAGGTGKSITTATADQTYAASQAAAAERARQSAANAAAAAESARLAQERQDAIDLAARVNAHTTPPAVFTMPKTFTPLPLALPGAAGGTAAQGAPPMLNANRDVTPIDSRPMSADLAGGAQVLPTNSTTASAPTDWKKYLPYALAALLVLALLYYLKGHKRASASA